jgi:hypothetical protein
MVGKRKTARHYAGKPPEKQAENNGKNENKNRAQNVEKKYFFPPLTSVGGVWYCMRPFVPKPKAHSQRVEGVKKKRLTKGLNFDTFSLPRHLRGSRKLHCEGHKRIRARSLTTDGSLGPHTSRNGGGAARRKNYLTACARDSEKM